MPTTIDLTVFGAGTFTIEDDGIVGNSRSQVRDQNGTIVATFNHDQTGINVVSGVGQHLVLNFTDSLGAANFSIGTFNDPPGTPGYVSPNPDSIEVNNLVTTGIVYLNGGTVTEFGNDAGIDIIAGQLSIRAASGIGTALNAIESQAARLQGETDTGGIYLDHYGDTLITAINGRSQRGLVVMNTGDVNFTIHGTLTGAGPRPGQISGNLWITALGATADVNTSSPLLADHGNIYVSAGRDILTRVGGGGGEVVVLAGRDFSGSLSGTNVNVTAGRDLILTDFGAGASGAISLTAGGTLRFADQFVDVQANGDIRFIADRMILTPATSGTNIVSAIGTVYIHPLTGGRAIDIGSLTDNAAALELSNAELARITASRVVIGDSASGTLTVSALFSPTTFVHLGLISGSDINVLAAMSFSTQPALGPRSIDLLAGGNITTTAAITVDAFSAIVDAFGASPGVGRVLTLAALNGASTIFLGGNGDNDTLNGTANAEVLSGGGGVDVMRGYAGNDTYIIDNAGDLVIEAVGQGYDVAFASVSYTLAAGTEVEGLVALDFNSTAALDFTGNEFANYLIGTAGANTLNGGAGADILEGRGGNDTYITDSLSDLVIETAGNGYDVVFTSFTYALNDVSEVEGLVTLDFNSTAAINLTGNGIANYLIGNAGDNQLNGLAGADVMEGRAGNDVYLADNAGDVAVESVGQGYDVVYTSASYALNNSYEVEGLSTLDWNATTAINLTGNNLANYMIGNAGANVLNGGAGSDALFGKGGADTFVFANALGANNVDQIGDFSAVDDTIQLDHTIFTGLGIGALGANAFVVGTQAGDADDRIIYNSATGMLYFDADGAGGNAAVLFAALSGNPTLTAADFLVI